MLQPHPVYSLWNRSKTLTGSPDPTHANGTNKPCNSGMHRHHRKKHFTMGIASSNHPQQKCTRLTTKKENVCRLQKKKQTLIKGNQSRWRKRMQIPHTPTKNRQTVQEA